MNKLALLAILVSSCGTVDDPNDKMFVIQLGEYQVSILYTEDSLTSNDLRYTYNNTVWMIWYENNNYTLNAQYANDPMIGHKSGNSIVFDKERVEEKECGIKYYSHTELFPTKSRDAFRGKGSLELNIKDSVVDGCEYVQLLTTFDIVGIKL